MVMQLVDCKSQDSLGHVTGPQNLGYVLFFKAYPYYSIPTWACFPYKNNTVLVLTTFIYIYLIYFHLTVSIFSSHHILNAFFVPYMLLLYIWYRTSNIICAKYTQIILSYKQIWEYIWNPKYLYILMF